MSASVVSIPYSQARPLILAGRLTAPLAAGAYTWDGSYFDASPGVELRSSFLYIVASLTFAADLDPADYSAAIDPTFSASPIPSFRILQRGGASVLADAVPAPAYFSDLGICYPFAPKVDGNRIQFSAQGRLLQTPALIGKASVSLAVSCVVYEVSDANWIRKFMARTPAPALPQGSKRVEGTRESIIMDAGFRNEVFG